MVSLFDLWLPILLSAVFVFIVSSIIHMVLKYHNSDFKGLPDETRIMEALRPFKIPPGTYFVPHAKDMASCKSPEYQEKVNNGPVAIMTVCPNGMPGMGGPLVLWFLNSVLISIFAAYVASRAVPIGGSYLEVFRFVGTTAFAGYALGLLQNSIWYKRSWGVTLKSVFDGLIYALVTAGAFGWLWPRM